MNLAVENLADDERQKLLRSAIGLRPPAWVGAVDRGGQFYLAPFAFITAVCMDPMSVLFCVNNGTDPAANQLLRALVTTGEFVINFPTAATIAMLNVHLAAAERDQAAVDWSNLTTPCQMICPPRLDAVSLAFECRLHQVMKMGYGPGGTSVVFGDVQQIYMDDQ